jgi:hypothetical protein
MNEEKIANELVRLAKNMVAGNEDSLADYLDGLRSIAGDSGNVVSKKEKSSGDSYEWNIILQSDKLVKVGVPDELVSEATEMEAEMKNFVRRGSSGIKKSIVERIERLLSMKYGAFTGRRLLSDIIGRRESEEFEIESVSVDSVSLGKNVELSNDRRKTLVVDGKILVIIKATKLSSLSDGVFSQMSDRELKKYIGQYADNAPENFWMDGEWNGSYAQRVKQLMSQWRGMSPREQQRTFNSMKGW